jgi:hypothetical protein
MAYAAYEDATLRRVLAVAMAPEQADSSASPPVVYLEELAQVSIKASIAIARACLPRAPPANGIPRPPARPPAPVAWRRSSAPRAAPTRLSRWTRTPPTAR